jgi:hypothetical protein
VTRTSVTGASVTCHSVTDCSTLNW